MKPLYHRRKSPPLSNVSQAHKGLDLPLEPSIAGGHEQVSDTCFKDQRLTLNEGAFTAPLRPLVTARLPGLSQCKYPIPGFA